MTVLLIAAVLSAVIGVFTLTQATLGAGLIALACFLGILARISQAAAAARPPTAAPPPVPYGPIAESVEDKARAYGLSTR